MATQSQTWVKFIEPDPTHILELTKLPNPTQCKYNRLYFVYTLTHLSHSTPYWREILLWLLCSLKICKKIERSETELETASACCFPKASHSTAAAGHSYICTGSSVHRCQLYVWSLRQRGTRWWWWFVVGRASPQTVRLQFLVLRTARRAGSNCNENPAVSAKPRPVIWSDGVGIVGESFHRQRFFSLELTSLS